MTEEQEAKLMQDRIRELRFVLKRPPNNEEIQESIRQRPINYKNEGVTDLTDIAVNPNRTVPDIGFREDPGDVSKYDPMEDDLNDEIMNLVQQVDGGEQNGLAQALNATKADDPVTTFSRSPEDLADEGSEVMKFDYLENGYHTITPLRQNVGPSGSLTFGPNDVITAETPDQKRDRINQTRKTVLSDPGLPEENVTAPRPVSEISDTSTVSESFDYLSAEGIPLEDVTETKEEVKRKNLAEVMVENFAEVINPDSEKQVVEQAEDPVELAQKNHC